MGKAVEEIGTINRPEWEERLARGLMEGTLIGRAQGPSKALVDFISSLLLSQRQELKEKVECLNRNAPRGKWVKFDDIINLLT